MVGAADAHAEELVIDKGRFEQQRALSARKTTRALVKANAQVLQARSRALREARLNEKQEKCEQRQYELQAKKNEERLEKAGRLEGRLNQSTSKLALMQQALDEKATRDLERHAAKDEALLSTREIERTTRSVLATEREERGGKARALADSMAEKRRTALIASQAYHDQRCEAFKEELASIRSRAAEAGREREVAKADEVAKHKDRLDRVREEKLAAWCDKLERVTNKQHAQQIVQQEIRRYNLEMDRKIGQLNDITERLAAPGGIASKQLHAQLHALQKELQDMAEAVPSSVTGLSSPGSIADPGLPRYLHSRPPSAEPPQRSVGKHAGGADKPDNDMYSPGNASTKAPTSAPGSPAIGVRIIPGQ